VAGALVRMSNQPQLLIAQRPPGKWMAGRWEFPGGKIEAGETGEAALRRELHEELGVRVQALRAIDVFTHDYDERRVAISLWLVTQWDGEPAGLDGQALRWVSFSELADCDLLEADLPMIGPLRQALK
jgi:8-oxo-dGTP diphosphatase